MLRQLLECGDTEDANMKKKKEWLVGSRQSLVDAVIALATFDMKHAEHLVKLKTAQPEQMRSFDKEDLRIIEQFLERHAQQHGKEK